MADALENRAQLVVLDMADEWLPARGGVSTFNRRLCGELARAGAKVYCTVYGASHQELEDAAHVGVNLVVLQRPAGPAGLHSLMHLPELPGGLVPDVIIGHGRITGHMAKVVKLYRYPKARRIQIVHVVPDEIEWWKMDRLDDVGTRADERSWMELDLARDADAVFAIGPRIHGWLCRELGALGCRRPLRLDPGFDGPDRAPRKPPEGRPLILVVARLEDDLLKGLDIAAKATGDARDLLGEDDLELELLLRGAPQGQAEDLWRRVREWSGRPSLHVTVRNYTTDEGQLLHDLRRATVLLMPSRDEGFGLAGLEAIAAGTPVLVSRRSGLAMLLREVLPSEMADRVMVPVADDMERDVRQWGHRIATVLGNRTAAFDDLAAVRDMMAEKRTWAMAAAQLLQEGSS
jgi:glycosyltransferase involved in cell wall biosynthesis